MATLKEPLTFKSESGTLRVYSNSGLITKPLFVMLTQIGCKYCAPALEGFKTASFEASRYGVPNIQLAVVVSGQTNLPSAARQSYHLNKSIEIRGAPAFFLFVDGAYVATHLISQKYIFNPAAAAMEMALFISRTLVEKKEAKAPVYDPNASCLLTMDQAYAKN